MKNIPKIVAVLSLMLAVACKKKDPDPVQKDTKASVSVEIDHKFGNNDFELGKTYIYNGARITFSTAQFYFSNPVIMDDAGTATTLNPQFTFVEANTSAIDLGKIEPGHAHMFQFMIGVDSTTNASVQPTDFNNMDDPLAPKVNSMWWNWNAGYQFYKFEGEIDLDSDGTVDHTFQYHIGTDAFAINSSTLTHSDLMAGEKLEMHLKIDYSKIFDGIDLSTEFHTKTMNNMPLAEKIKTNFTSAISVEAHGH